MTPAGFDLQLIALELDLETFPSFCLDNSAVCH